MTTCCPCRHISYAVWRQQIFHWLFAASSNPLIVNRVLTQPYLTDGHNRRHIASSVRVPAQSYKVRILPEESGRTITQEGKASKLLQDNIDKVGGTQAAAFHEEHGLRFEQGQSPPSGERATQVGRIASLEHEGHKHSTQANLATLEKGLKDKNKPLNQRQRPQQWSPYDESGRNDLRDLAASLQSSLRPSGNLGHGPSEAGSQSKLSSSLPLSPLIQALEQKKLTKLSPRGTEKEELANNPWAAMLASPMRLCSATGVRLPKDLLVPWGLVRNPATKEIYFMPTELAALDSLKDRRRSSKPPTSASVKRPIQGQEDLSSLELERHALQNNSDAESDRKIMDSSTAYHENNRTEETTRVDKSSITSDASQPLPPPRSISTSYMLPFLPLLHHLTVRFSALQRDRVTRRSKPNALNSIIPYRLKVSVDRANFYAEQQTKTLNYSAPKERAKAPSLTSFMDVKWDAGIDEVMLRILRERLLATLEMLGNRNQKLWRQKRELVQAFRVTRASVMNSNEGSWKLLIDDDDAQLGAQRGNGPDGKSVSICLLIKPDGANSPAVQQRVSTETTLVAEEVSQNSRSTLFESIVSSAATDDSWRNHLVIEPATIKVDQCSNLPLFPLSELFDVEYMSRFQQLSAAIGVLAPRHMKPNDVDGHAYVLIVPANAFGAKYVFEEIWRLWRFLGGRRT